MSVSIVQQAGLVSEPQWMQWPRADSLLLPGVDHQPESPRSRPQLMKLWQGYTNCYTKYCLLKRGLNEILNTTKVKMINDNTQNCWQHYMTHLVVRFLLKYKKFIQCLLKLLNFTYLVIQLKSLISLGVDSTLSKIPTLSAIRPLNISAHLFLNNQQDAIIIQIYSFIKLYIFRTSALPIIRSFLLYIRHW
jgi:hypothetical protein